MDLVRCNQGHYYDAAKYPVCPYCSGQGPISGATQHVNPSSPGDAIPKTHYLSTDARSRAAEIPVTSKLNASGEKTVGLLKARTGIDPVVGWLICIEGVNKGRDYRIMSGQNFIGRGDTMDICIKGDDSISRERHAVIVYDSRSNLFLVRNGEGRDIVYVNDSPILGAMELHMYDILEIGESRMIFIPLCGEVFKWE